MPQPVDVIAILSSEGTVDTYVLGGTLGGVNTITTVNSVTQLQSVKSGTVNIANSPSIGGGSIGQVNNLGTLQYQVGLGTVAEITSIKSGTINLGGMAGSPTTPSDVVSVLSTTTTILNPNATRQYAGLMNLGGTPVYLAFGGQAGTARGLRLSPSGLYEITQQNLWKGSVTGVQATGADGTVVIGITDWG